MFKIFERKEFVEDEKILQHILALELYIDIWEDNFKKEFFKNQMPEKLVSFCKSITTKRFIKPISSLFFGLSAKSNHEELKSFYPNFLVLYQYLLNDFKNDEETFNNVNFLIYFPDQKKYRRLYLALQIFATIPSSFVWIC